MRRVRDQQVLDRIGHVVVHGRIPVVALVGTDSVSLSRGSLIGVSRVRGKVAEGYP